VGCFRPVQGVGFERSCRSAAISGRRAPDQDPCAFCRCRIQWANDARPALSPVSALFRIRLGGARALWCAALAGRGRLRTQRQPCALVQMDVLRARCHVSWWSHPPRRPRGSSRAAQRHRYCRQRTLRERPRVPSPRPRPACGALLVPTTSDPTPLAAPHHETLASTKGEASGASTRVPRGTWASLCSALGGVASACES